jgi:hypothetical protein
VTLSSTTAEYSALSHPKCQLVWLNKLLYDLQVDCDNFKLYSDNLSNISLARNPVFHARSKYIDVQYHHEREKVLASEFDMHHVRTDFQVADIFTKFLDIVKFKEVHGQV